MDSIPSTLNSRARIAAAIEQAAGFGITAIQDHRQKLKRGDAVGMILDTLDPLINTAKLGLRSNTDIRSLSEGVTDRGIAWLIRIFARGIGRAILTTDAAMLRSFTYYLHLAADTIDGALAQEEREGEGEVNEARNPPIG